MTRLIHILAPIAKTHRPMKLTRNAKYPNKAPKTRAPSIVNEIPPTLAMKPLTEQVIITIIPTSIKVNIKDACLKFRSPRVPIKSPIASKSPPGM